MNILVIVLSGILAATIAAPLQSKNDSEVSSLVSLSDSISKFNLKFYSEIAKTADDNIFYSPFSIHMILTQLILGSPEGSATRNELAKLLHLDAAGNHTYLESYRRARQDQLLQQHHGSIVRIGNKLYYSAKQFNVKPKFREELDKYFLSSTEEIDVTRPEETSDMINSFVKNQTNGLIDKILEADDISPKTAMILVNAIYFKGSWKYPFKEQFTKTATFYVNETQKTDYQAMTTSESLKTFHSDSLKSSILELPYENDKISMVIVLPDANTGLREVEAKLEISFILKKLTSVQPTPDVEVEIPKFETSFEVKDMEGILKRLGVERIFDSRADLSEISESPIYVSKISHKAVVKVNEEGSEAAAVTSVEISLKSYMEPVKFIVNRPFLFYIVNVVSGLPLFVGRIVDPNGKMKLSTPSKEDDPISTLNDVIPTTDGVVPTTNTMRTTTEDATPTTNNFGSTTDDVGPTSNTPRPTTNTSRPTTNTPRPTKNTPRPTTTNDVKPSTNDVKPSTNDVRATANAKRTATNNVRTKTDDMETTTDYEELTTSLFEAKTASAETRASPNDSSLKFPHLGEDTENLKLHEAHQAALRNQNLPKI